MSSLHWLILNGIVWAAGAWASISLENAHIMWAPGCVTVALIIALALLDDLKNG